MKPQIDGFFFNFTKEGGGAFRVKKLHGYNVIRISNKVFTFQT